MIRRKQFEHMKYLNNAQTSFFNFVVYLSPFGLVPNSCCYWFRSNPSNHKRFSFCCRRSWSKFRSREWLFDKTPAKYSTHL